MYVLAKTPPELESNVFYKVATDIPVYIPCGTTGAYKYVYQWKDFTNYIGLYKYSLSVATQDSVKGYVRITQLPSCENGESVFEAIANDYCFFVQWNDGNTDNPRTVIVDKDMTFTAEFGGGVCTVTATCDLQQGVVTGGGKYGYGTQITLYAIPNSGYEFKQWDNGLTYNPYRFTVLDDLTIEALFVPITAVEDVRADSSLPQKVLRNGQVYILRGGKTYTLMGVECN